MSVSSIDPDEVARFSALAAKWWDPKGAFAPLHRFNPIRLEFIRDQAARAFGRDPHAPDFNGLRLLDVGCGGGLLSEPMARLGFAVTAIDASDKNIKTAQAHAEAGGLAIDFRATTVEDLAASNPEPFDLILNMEVIEHVAEPKSFIANSARLLAPSGFMIVATLNRTLKAHLLGVVGAEYVLRWLPVGTHDWRKFIKPTELSGFLREAGLSPDGPYGVAYNPLTARFSLSPDTDVNYMMIGRRPA